MFNNVMFNAFHLYRYTLGYPVETKVRAILSCIMKSTVKNVVSAFFIQEDTL